jgi:hypothetical protein
MAVVVWSALKRVRPDPPAGLAHIRIPYEAAEWHKGVVITRHLT